VNPPTCSYCPDAHLTSTAMLMTHLQSKKHSNRVREQHAQNSGARQHQASKSSSSSSSGTAASETTAISREAETGDGQQDATMQDATIAAAAAPLSNTAMTSTPTPTWTSTFAAPIEVSPSPAPPLQKSAKLRRRKAERDRKKARTRRDRLNATPHVSSPAIQAAGVVAVDTEAATTAATTITTTTTVPVATTVVDGRAEQSKEEEEEKEKEENGQEVRMEEADHGASQDSQRRNSTLMQSPAVASASINTCRDAETDTDTVMDTTHTLSHWHCTICGSSWHRERAWRGHLTSAQHLRRVMRTMRKTAPPLAPYGRKDVLAAMDPFGWGTSEGAEEEEEEEEEEESEEETEKSQGEKTRGTPAGAKEIRNGDSNNHVEQNDDMDTGE
ncbi:hypothetical protein BGZ98_003915, partial [Dissophora globulifera]